MFCIKCGSQIEDGSRFCQSCGAPVESTAEYATSQTQPEYYSAPTSTYTESKKETGAFDSKPILWGILLMLLGGVLTAISYATSENTYRVYSGLLVVGFITFAGGIINKIKRK